MKQKLMDENHLRSIIANYIITCGHYEGKEFTPDEFATVLVKEKLIKKSSKPALTNSQFTCALRLIEYIIKETYE